MKSLVEVEIAILISMFALRNQLFHDATEWLPDGSRPNGPGGLKGGRDITFP